jgi:hypothetical protein
VRIVGGAINLTLGRVMPFAGLLYYQNTADLSRAKFVGDTQVRVTAITQPLLKCYCVYKLLLREQFWPLVY